MPPTTRLLSILEIIWLTISVIAVAVELPGRKPYWFQDKNLLESRKLKTLLKINFSNMLFIRDKTEIGRYLTNNVLVPFLGIGDTLAIFNLLG
jgi:hypothetical protein